MGVLSFLCLFLLGGTWAQTFCPSTNTIPGCGNPADNNTWFKLRNDECICPWDCIDCHGGAASPFTGTGRQTCSERQCTCPLDTMSMDCQGCTSNKRCPAGEICDRSVFVTRVKTYSCVPDSNLAQVFGNGGLFVFTMTFPSASVTAGGTAHLDCYTSPAHGPLLFSCDLTQCARSIVADGQVVQCQTISCTPTGGGDTTLNNLVNSLSGWSRVVFQTAGAANFFQQQVPIAVAMNCAASGCKQPLEGETVQSRDAIIAASVVGAMIPVIVGVLVFWCWFSGVRLKRAYLKLGDAKVQYTVKWDNISCTLALPVRGTCFKKTHFDVLKPCSGVAYPGTMTAVIGESGAGKTTFLDMIALRKTLGAKTGQVRVNGAIPGKEWPRISGYVIQHDLFLETMTAREHLDFVANLKLPVTMTQAERRERVELLLDQLNLRQCENTIIGGLTRKGLSGGEKKRLSIAAEMLADPGILIVDEPTSGLDSVNAFRVLSCLRRLATEMGKTVIFSIHSPDSVMFSQFDRVILMARGYTVYSGPAAGLVASLEHLPHKVDLQAHAAHPAELAIYTVANMSAQEIEDSVGRAPNVRKGARRSGDDLEMEEMEEVMDLNDVMLGPSRPDEIGPYTQPWLWQMWYVMKRSLVDAWRNPFLLRLVYICIVVAGLILGGMFFKLNLTVQGAQNRAGLLFYIVTLLTILTLPSIDTFHTERALFLRERSTGYYSSSAYLVAKALADILPLRLVPPIILTCIVYWMAGLEPVVEKFFWMILVNILVSYCATAVCLFISSLSPTVAVGNLIAILVFLFVILFGGLLLNLSTLPVWLSWLKWLSFIYHAFSALMTKEMENRTFKLDVANSSFTLSGSWFLQLFGLDPSLFYLNIYVLLVMGTVFFIVSAVVLAYVLKEQR